MYVDEAAIVLVGILRDLAIKERRNKGEFVVATHVEGSQRSETSVPGPASQSAS